VLQGLTCKLFHANELHDISFGDSAVVRQPHVVAIQHLHGRKVSGPDTNDYDAEGLVCSVDDGLLGLLHVLDNPVGDDQQNTVVLQIRSVGC